MKRSIDESLDQAAKKALRDSGVETVMLQVQAFYIFSFVWMIFAGVVLVATLRKVHALEILLAEQMRRSLADTAEARAGAIPGS
mmetsp:Transcript_3722/g.7421  ORF Transcript_3722/g.7421 Transcript_3722/m.7421 type:complete len:84 (+) Transcript_3722:168-419(+)